MQNNVCYRVRGGKNDEAIGNNNNIMAMITTNIYCMLLYTRHYVNLLTLSCFSFTETIRNTVLYHSGDEEAKA